MSIFIEQLCKEFANSLALNDFSEDRLQLFGDRLLFTRQRAIKILTATTCKLFTDSKKLQCNYQATSDYS